MLRLFVGMNQQDSLIYRWSSEGWERSACRHHICGFFHTDNRLINMDLQPVASHLVTDGDDMVEPVILSTEMLHYFSCQWGAFHSGMRKGFCANASSQATQYQYDFLLEVNIVEDQLEDLEFMYVYSDQWVEYKKRAVGKFEEDEEGRDKSMDELHGRAKVDAALRVFDDSDCPA
jgi:hypothetical protein